jgi:hypothetical protein
MAVEKTTAEDPSPFKMDFVKWDKEKNFTKKIIFKKGSSR